MRSEAGRSGVERRAREIKSRICLTAYRPINERTIGRLLFGKMRSGFARRKGGNATVNGRAEHSVCFWLTAQRNRFLFRSISKLNVNYFRCLVLLLSLFLRRPSVDGSRAKLEF